MNPLIQKAKEMKTITELQIELNEEIRKAEMRFWQKQNPKAKVVYDKENNQIVVIYPLPTQREK